MPTFEVTHQPSFSELDQWHHEEKRDADTVFQFESWDAAMRKLVLGKEKEITDSWPVYWIFPYQKFDSKNDVNRVFNNEKYPKLGYRIGYTIQVLHCHIRRVQKEDPRHGVMQDWFLSNPIHNTQGQMETYWFQIERFMQKFREPTGVHQTTKDSVGVTASAIHSDAELLEDYIEVDDEEDPPEADKAAFTHGVYNAKFDIRDVENLQKNGDTEGLANFRIRDYEEDHFEDDLEDDLNE